MLFKDLSLIEPLLRALETEGYEQPTPIQEQAIPPVLQHRDLLGCAQTGTGKTAAFGLPILQILKEEKDKSQAGGKVPIRCLILTPTRELAIQIGESLTAYGRHTGVRNLVIFGGVSQGAQTEALRKGTDILVATPGRLLDLMNQGFVNLQQISIFVLDEADRMLDMGFIHDVKKVIAKIPAKRQTLFFSATMPPEIANLAHSILRDPVQVEVTPVSSTAEKVEQAIYFVDKGSKKSLLIHLLKDNEIRSALVFTRTKHGANKVAADLVKAGVRTEAIHGNKSQNARQQALSNFKSGKTRVLVATDIAARGIDIEELSHVVNFELPNVPETYVHRIGRTGRAGASGIALSFCEAEELPYLRDIQKLTGQKVPVVSDHPFAADLEAPGVPQPRTAKGGGQSSERRPNPPQRDRDRDRDRDRRPEKGQSQKNKGPMKRGHISTLPESELDTRTPRQERRQDAGQQGPKPERRFESGKPQERRPESGPPQRDSRRPSDDSRRGGDRDRGFSKSSQGAQKWRSGPLLPTRSQRPATNSRPVEKPDPGEKADFLRNRFDAIFDDNFGEKQESKRKDMPHHRTVSSVQEVKREITDRGINTKKRR
jgi:ATP-dependent RNA helicase RhlE